MAFDIGINFRATAEYVTDPANTTYSLGEGYPTTRGGATFGWIDLPLGNIRNRSASVDPRIAGINYHTNASKKKFQLDLPASGSVDIYCAVGDAKQAALSGYMEVFDNTTSLGVIVSKHLSMPSDVFYDATDTSYSAASWPGSNAKATFTFATTTLVVAVSPGDSVGSNFVISHLRAIQSASGITLTGTSSTEINTANTAAVTQAHVLAGAVSSQAHAAGAGAITQGQLLAAAASAQANTAGTGSIALATVLTGAASIQANAASSDAIIQTHVLTASTSTQNGTSSAIAITQVHVLAAAASTQGNLGGIDAITLGSGDLVGAPSTQENISANVTISVTRTLTAPASTQANLSGTGAISDGIVVEAALTTGVAETVRIKKPGIPAGTPEWLKTMLEILTGRRGNRIEAPRFQALTFSTMPTRAECEALYRYTNTVRDSLEQLINRMDG